MFAKHAVIFPESSLRLDPSHICYVKTMAFYILALSAFSALPSVVARQKSIAK